MPACPNCGRQTLRTKDWACQWCGYPLVSRAFKKIDKTFKELQEERSLNSRSAQSEEEPAFESEYTPEPEPEPPPRYRPPVKPVYRPVPEPEPAPKTESTPVPEAVSRPVEPVVPPQPQQPVIQLPPAEPATAPPPRAEIAPAQEPLITPPPLPKQEIPSASKPEMKIRPEPAPMAAIKLEEIQDGTEITADQIDALFKADKSVANSKFAGKTLVINGIVEKVFVREHLDIRYIMLAGTQKKMTWSLRCTFDKVESSKLIRLNEGQAVAVRGKYDGYSKNIIFKDCVLV